MFGLGIKSRTEEAVRRSMRASLMGAYLHPEDIEKLNLNEDASAWLLTESYAHNLFILGIVFTKHCQEKWATFEFFTASVIAGMKESLEKDNGPDPSILAPILFERFHTFQAMAGDDRVAGKHYLDSASLVVKRDPTAEASSIANILESSAKKYMMDVDRMFGS